MSGRKRTQPRAAKRSLTEEMKMARLNGTSLAAQMRWAINDGKRMRESAAKALGAVMFAEMPQAPVIDSAQVGRTPQFEPDPCSITHHDHLPAPSLLPHRAQDGSVAGVLPSALPAPLPVVAVSDEEVMPDSQASYSHQDLNDSEPSSPIAPIVLDEQPSAFLIRKVSEQVAEIDCLEERVTALDSQMKTRDEQISALVSQKQTLEAKIAKQRRELKKQKDAMADSEEESAMQLRRVIENKDKEIRRHQAYLQHVLDTHLKQITVLERRSAEIESESKKIGAQLEQLPEVKAEFAGIPSGGVRFTPRVVHHPGAYFMTARPEPEDEPPFAFGQIADVD
jgi:hypothetical protein